MTNKDLQKELKEKVKEGVKPSDLKKKKSKDSSQSDQIDQSVSTPLITPNQQIKELEQQITSLKKQLQTYKDFKEADLKLKERYKEEIKEKTQIINKLGTNQPSNSNNQEYFSHYLTEADKKKLIRYEKLHLERVKDNWGEELQELKENKKPFDLPPTWREELKTIEELRKRPTWEALHKAVGEEKGKYKDYETIKETLKTWTDLFGTDTVQQVKKKLDEKPSPTTLSPEDKEAIKNYAKLKENYNTLKTSKDKEIGNLKQQIKIKNAELDKLKGWKTQLPPDSLVEQIRQKVIQAYNSTDYLNGYYEKLMRQFLNWEVAGTEEQKNAIKNTKSEVNKCLNFLENIGSIKNPNIKV